MSYNLKPIKIGGSTMIKLLRVCVAIAGLALGLLVWAGCSDDKGVGPNVGTTTGGTTTPLNAEWKLLKEGSSGQSLVGTTWLWETVTRMNFASPSALGNKAYTLTFGTDGTIKVYTYVNEFSGTYTVVSRGSDEIYKINIADFGGTKVGENEELDVMWSSSFPTVNSFSLKDDVLTLFYNDGRDSLVYIPTGGTATGDVRPDAVSVSYKKYSLEESACEWKEDRFAASNGTVVVINNNESLENYVGCIEGTYPAVDFSRQTLLVATGLEAYQNTPVIGTLVKNPDGAYAMEVNMNVSDAPAPNFWQVSVVVDKIDDDSRISVAVQRYFMDAPVMNCGGGLFNNSGDGLFKKNCGVDGSGWRSE